MNLFREFIKNGITASIILLISGLCLAIFPSFFIHTVCYILGALSIAYAVIRFIAYFSSQFSYFGIGASFLFFILGIALISNPYGVASMLPTIIGIYLVIDGISKLKKAIDYKNMNISGWQAVAIPAAISIIAGILLWIFAHGVTAIALRVIGVIFIVKAIEGFFNFSYVRKKIDKSTPIEGDFSDNDK